MNYHNNSNRYSICSNSPPWKIRWVTASGSNVRTDFAEVPVYVLICLLLISVSS